MTMSEFETDVACGVLLTVHLTTAFADNLHSHTINTMNSKNKNKKNKNSWRCPDSNQDPSLYIAPT